jgi:hypothetical protein
VLGVAASVVANVLHAQDNPISQAIAAWPPLALLLTVELISRVPVHRPALAFARLFATATIAGIAAWVSYWHMVGVAFRYGETGASPYLLPLSVDGLIIVASICLVELGGRISTVETAAAPPARPGAATPQAHTVPAAAPTVTAAPAHAQPATTAAAQPATTAAATAHAQAATTAAASARAQRAQRATAAAAGAHESGAKRRGPKPAGASGAATRPRRSAAETAALAARLSADRPAATHAEIAAELGISAARLRTVQREAARSDDLRLAA